MITSLGLETDTSPEAEADTWYYRTLIILEGGPASHLHFVSLRHFSLLVDPEKRKTECVRHFANQAFSQYTY